MKLVFSATGTILFAVLWMYVHDLHNNRPLEITFFGLAVVSALIFEWLLHKS